MTYTRVYLIVLDGLGVGSAPDAAEYGDTGSDTLLNIAQVTDLEIPNLATLGLGSLYQTNVPGLPKATQPQAHFCRLTELSAGKDTTTGHWELMGLHRITPSPTFPAGFPVELIAEFERLTGRSVLGNKVASGTEIIAELGPAQLSSGSWIVYTSADSVFQLAAHTAVIPLDELYAACESVRELLSGEMAVDRVIARPFTGDVANGFARTVDRKDYSLKPPGKTFLNVISERGRQVIGVGKISDIFAGEGISLSYPDHGNTHLMDRLSSLSERRDWDGLVFCNLVDFDMLFGHRNNPQGYAAALGEFDAWLGRFLAGLATDELVLLTADHGNDPTTPSTDHSREQVPLLITSTGIMAAGGRALAPPPGFYHVGATVAGVLGAGADLPGLDLLED